LKNRLNTHQLREIKPLTKNQNKAFGFWKGGSNLVLNGSAGTGKTFLAVYLALKDVMDKNTPYEKVIIVRSVVPTREMGFLPGTEDEKMDAYSRPYVSITAELFDQDDAWIDLVQSNRMRFESTSFVRGLTWDNAIVIVDEMQNLNFHELDSVITRVGLDCRFILCGDYYQSDFERKKDREGVVDFLKITKMMSSFKVVEFTWSDIVRSDFVKDYIMTKEMLEQKGELNWQKLKL
jgi:phosphate starvation-inducible protein PhoH and related proteins